MSALAQYHVMNGGSASGSDRSFDRGESGDVRRYLEAAGVRIRPQDGSGVTTSCSGIVVSGAVEPEVPDMRRAAELGIPVVRRPELLARFSVERHTTAVAGSSGKSTVAAMVFDILDAARVDPSLITGGNLLSLRDRGFLGNAWAGNSDILVMEADESDGTLVLYEPWVGVVLNLHHDHGEPQALLAMFEAFRDQTRGPFLVSDAESLSTLRESGVTFGLTPGADYRAEEVELSPEGSRFTVSGVEFRLPVPGLHNVENALAAAAASRASGVALETSARALEGFRGVERRFQTLGRARGVEVIDDFAHNPEKVRAALAAAAARGTRVLAVFQPHGFKPLRFMRRELVQAFAAGLGREDRLWMPDVYYVGGTTTREVSSREVVEDARRQGVRAEFAESRESLVEAVVGDARSGDVVLVMGARDPSLAALGRTILERLERRSRRSPEEE
jgi:UDP-N-acetylmuramate-alanine ligase